MIQKDITLGELVKDDKTIFTVANLETVWIDLSIFRRDFGSLAVGSRGRVSYRRRPRCGPATHPGEGGLHFAVRQRRVANDAGALRGAEPEGILRPGLYVDGEVVTGEVAAAVTVKNGALQEIEGKTVVFVAEGEAFEARVVEVGVRDDERVEITADCARASDTSRTTVS